MENVKSFLASYGLDCNPITNWVEEYSFGVGKLASTVYLFKIINDAKVYGCIFSEDLSIPLVFLRCGFQRIFVHYVSPNCRLDPHKEGVETCLRIIFPNFLAQVENYVFKKLVVKYQIDIKSFIELFDRG